MTAPSEPVAPRAVPILKTYDAATLDAVAAACEAAPADDARCRLLADYANLRDQVRVLENGGNR